MGNKLCIKKKIIRGNYSNDEIHRYINGIVYEYKK